MAEEPDAETHAGVAMAKRRLETFSEERAAGWYPLGTNPNEQSYWDGSAFTGIRHWVGGRGWVEDDGAPAAPTTNFAPEPSGVFRPQQINFGRRSTDQASFTIGVLLLITCGIALMFGSLGAWVTNTTSVASLSVQTNVNGTDPSMAALIGVNGWVTFVGGIVLLVFAGLAITSNEGVLVRLTLLVSVVTMIFAVYDMFRTIQKISHHAGYSIGWGLICVLSAAVLATLISLTRMVKAR